MIIEREILIKNKDNLDELQMIMLKVGRTSIRKPNKNFYDSLVSRYKSGKMKVIFIYKGSEQEEKAVK